MLSSLGICRLRSRLQDLGSKQDHEHHPGLMWLAVVSTENSED